jgi:dolichol-phosphate mannosyltransferase
MMSDPVPANAKVLVFVPTLNDVEHLTAIADAVRLLDGAYTILILDDGSAAPIDRMIDQNNCLHFRLPTNSGLGVCTHIAFDHALREDYSAVVRVDADGQHPVTMIPALLAELNTGAADVVVASRSNRNEGTGWRIACSRIVRSYLSAVAQLLTDGRVPSDVNSGFFAANRTAMETLNICRLERFPEPQMYILACRRGLQISEVPVEQKAREHGSSSVTLSHALRILYRFNIFVLSELLHKRGD